ncbi:MAG: carboxypeptidase-like regulatory domain-containing protein [Polyangia bacterium]
MSRAKCKFLWVNQSVLWGFVALILSLAGGLASADPTLEVRGRMRLELDQVERHERTLSVAGRLMDEAQSEPMSGWTVALRVSAIDDRGQEAFVFGAAMPTDEDGTFAFRVNSIGPNRYVLHLSAPGDTVYAAPAPIDREIDLGRRSIELHLLVPPEQPARASTLPVGLEAVALDRSTASNAGDAPYEDGVAVDLDVDGVATATIVLSGGRATTQLTLPRATAGKEVVVRARFAGDATRGPAEATQRVRLVEDAALTLTTDATRVVAGSELVVHGRLTFGDRGVGGLPVTIHVLTDDGDTTARTVDTDPTGAYEALVRTPDRLRVAFQAQFEVAEAKARSLPSARSEVLIVELTRGFSLVDLGSRPAGAALAIAGLLLGALALLRLGAWLAPRRAKVAALAKAVAEAPPRATLRTTTDHRVAGRVLDGERAVALVGAKVRLVGAADSLTTDTRGAFDLGTLLAGRYELEIVHSGYARLVLPLVVPHRGEHSLLEARLVPLRAEILRVYGAALAPYVPRDAKLGQRTPRELAQVARFAPAQTVAALRRLVEESCYGLAGPDAATLARIEALSAELPPPPSS